MVPGKASTGNAMAGARDHCPDCEKKLHPQEIAALFSGKKIDCWYCTAPLKASVGRLSSSIAAVVVGLAPMISPLSAGEMPFWRDYVFVGLIAWLAYLLPPGLVHGAPWVKIVTRKPA